MRLAWRYGMPANANVKIYGGIGMGVNHGGRGTSPQNLEWGTLMQIVYLDFVMFQNVKRQIACITMQ